MSQTHSHEVHRDDEGSKLGMWLFIFTELLLFGGLFLVYSVYRANYSSEFHEAGLELNAFLGTLNTLVLLLSSMTVAMSITAIQKADKKMALRMLALTLLFATVFLVNKYFEWGAKIHHGLFPGSEHLMQQEHGHVLFFGLYFAMTGLHLFHLLIGMIILLVLYFKVKNGSIRPDKYQLLENGGLYWHLVDLIWIFLFPLLYLIA